MSKSLSESEYLELLKAKEREISFLKEELLKSAHQIERIAERLEKQDDISRSLLKLLSPTQLPGIPGYEISSKFISSTGPGGEYLEILNFSEKHKFGLLMSHSSGYGLSAIFLACLLKYSSELQSSKKWSTKTFIKNIEAELKAKMSEGDKASLLYGVMDKSKSQFDFSGAGHYKFLLIDANSQCEILPMPSPEIVQNKTWEPKTTSIKVDYQSSLIVLSPGFCSTVDSQHKELSDKQILTCVQDCGSSDLHELRNSLLLLQQEHSGLSKPQKDTSIVIWKNLDRSLKLASTEGEA